MKKILKRISAMFLVGLVGVSAVACSFEKPEWLEQALCDHVFDEEEIIKEPTCGSSGKKEKICSDCGKTETVSIKATGEHTWDGGTTTDKGMKYTCTTCGKTKTEEGKLVTTEVPIVDGESAVGNTYRIYSTSPAGGLVLSDWGDSVHLFFTEGYDANFFESGPYFIVDGLEIERTSEYADFYIQAGTFEVYNEEDDSFVKSITISNNCTIKQVSGYEYCSVRLEKRLVVPCGENAHIDSEWDGVCDNCMEPCTPTALNYRQIPYEEGMPIVDTWFRIYNPGTEALTFYFDIDDPEFQSFCFRIAGVQSSPNSHGFEIRCGYSQIPTNQDLYNYIEDGYIDFYIPSGEVIFVNGRSESFILEKDTTVKSFTLPAGWAMYKLEK